MLLVTATFWIVPFTNNESQFSFARANSLLRQFSHWSMWCPYNQHVPSSSTYWLVACCSNKSFERDHRPNKFLEVPCSIFPLAKSIFPHARQVNSEKAAESKKGRNEFVVVGQCSLRLTYRCETTNSKRREFHTLSAPNLQSWVTYALSTNSQPKKQNFFAPLWDLDDESAKKHFVASNFRSKGARGLNSSSNDFFLQALNCL